MMFNRHAIAERIEAPTRTSGTFALADGSLRSDEVSRFAVRLVVVDRSLDTSYVTPFARLPQLLRAGDIVVVNDAATLPAALPGMTDRSGLVFELRLSAPVDGSRLHGVLLGAGDHRTRTEHRPPPPFVAVGDHLRIGVIDAVVEAKRGRHVTLMTSLAGSALWQALYAAGKPVQYAHRPELLPLYAVQTAYAARPWAVEMPSAGRALTWDVLLGLRRAGIALATLTHAAGLSSTGDDALDRALPWPERYEIPQRTLDEIARAKARGGRVIAIGTTVVRALESAGPDARGGSGVATLRLEPAYVPRVVDGLVSGLHVPGESHFELLSAFAPRERLQRAIALASAQGMSAHELGDACLVI
jgi:S-adenosylmethionine:tRNA ribosyltransferase-isomerase